MSRYTGPKLKKMRALGLNLPGLSRKSIHRRPYGPGQQSQGRRRKISEYGLRLREKQKLRFNYGITERQLRRLVEKARKKKGDTRDNVARLLESRLDNVVFRAGFGPTIPSARQLVNHGHLRVNGRRVDIPSFLVKPGDVVQLKEKSRELPFVKEGLEGDAPWRPDWLSVTPEAGQVAMVSAPDATALLFDVDLLMVVEFYSH